MVAKLTVLAGPPRSGKTNCLLEQYRRVLAENKPGSAIWLAPTWRVAAQVRAQLLTDADGCFSPGVMTFEKFADAVLAVAPVAIRPLTRLMKRQLVRHLVDQQFRAHRLTHFGPIAQTGGLVDLICEFISELKRLEIWPDTFREACAARGADDKDSELAEIYENYQQCLQEHQLYDAEGRFWSARDWLQQGLLPASNAGKTRAGRVVQRLQLVVADGFTDFTRTQHEILEILARGVREVAVTLPLEREPRRDDLFTKPLKTLEEFRRRRLDLEAEIDVRELPRPTVSQSSPPVWPAMAHIEQQLFGNPRHVRAAPATDGVEILAAARQLGEIELIGERVKRLLTEDGVPPGDIAVVFRTPKEPGSLVSEVFGSFGIPFAMEVGDLLDRSPALRALTALLELDVDDWPFGELLAVLRSNYFRPAWEGWEPQTADEMEHVVRNLQVPRGRQRLLEQLKTSEAAALDDLRAADAEAPQRSTEKIDPTEAGLRSTTLAMLERLAETLDAMPTKTTLAGWGKAWSQLADETGLARVLADDPPTDPPVRLSDETAWTRLMAALEAGDTLSEWLQHRPVELNREEALSALKDVLTSELVSSGDDEHGQVRVLSAASVRALQIPYVFVAGLSEKAFPPPEREDRFYNEADYQQLIEKGLPLVARTERNREEMLLFYEILNVATKRLYLSYPALDEAGQPLSPSPYLQEVEQACGDTKIQRTELTDLSPIPKDTPLREQDFRIKAVDEGLRGRPAMLAGLAKYRRENAAKQPSPARTRATKPSTPSRPAPPKPIPDGARRPPEPKPTSGPLRQMDLFSSEDEPGADGLRQRTLFSISDDDTPKPDPTPTAEPAPEVEKGAADPVADANRLLAEAAEEMDDAAGTPVVHAVQPVEPPIAPPEPDHEPLAIFDPTPQIAENVLAGLAHIDLRQSRETFSAAEGMLTGAATSEVSAKYNYGRTFSATELERYAFCPYRFFLERVLHLNPLEDLTLAIDFLHRGLAAHEILATFHRRVKQRLKPGESPLDLPPETFDRLLAEVLDEEFRTEPSNPVTAALREVDRRQLASWLAEYRKQYEGYDKTWKQEGDRPVPEFFEVSFGHPVGHEEEPSTPRPLEFSAGGRTIRLSGRIDRIDVGRVDVGSGGGTPVFNVLDYKTGGYAKIEPATVRSGMMLQLPIYAIATAELLLRDRDTVPWQAGYWYVAGRGFPSRNALHMHSLKGKKDAKTITASDDWTAIRETLGETIFALAEGIRRGEFPVYSQDEYCTSFCPFKTVCRINHVRPLEKTWHPATPNE